VPGVGGCAAAGSADKDHTAGDVDSRGHEGAIALVKEKQERAPQAVTDFRRILDDKAVDILVCAAPNHWHAPATILGCQAGKHVYVEKPCSHTAEEGEWAVAAARKHNRVVQMGSQRRTWPAIREGIERVYAGEIGAVRYARTWYNNRRPSIGKHPPSSPPVGLDWALWQGPAPDRPFKENIVHYNWHWHWHWGNGELGNNGVHAIDIARWGLGVDYPTRVTSGGGKYRHDDDQETPDTMMVTFDFAGNKTITWEGLSWSPYGSGGSMFGVSLHGDEGTLVVADPGYKIFDKQNKEKDVKPGVGGDRDHVQNFLTAITEGKRPHADIEEAHKSTLLCHLGNVAYRVGRVLKTDAANGHIVGDEDAAKLWGREYRPGWAEQLRGAT
jgi:predicted dehydrogenase